MNDAEITFWIIIYFLVSLVPTTIFCLANYKNVDEKRAIARILSTVEIICWLAFCWPIIVPCFMIFKADVSRLEKKSGLQFNWEEWSWE